MRIFRQGDVLLKQVNELPRSLKLKRDKILAFGEATGHAHRFNDALAQLYADVDGKQYVFLVQDALLEHEEHADMMIPKGSYEVVIQREFDIIGELERPVVD
jgi:hypothetical protein